MQEVAEDFERPDPPSLGSCADDVSHKGGYRGSRGSTKVNNGLTLATSNSFSSLATFSESLAALSVRRHLRDAILCSLYPFDDLTDFKRLCLLESPDHMLCSLGDFLVQDHGAISVA